MNYKLHRGLFIIVLSISILASCQRDEISLPVDETNTPVFHFSADLDGINASLEAGVDEKFMHTDHELDQFEISTYIGHIGEESCAEMCEGSFRFALRSYDVEEKTDLSKALPPSFFQFKNNLDIDEGKDVFRVGFNSIFDESNPSFLWNFGDGIVTSTVADPIHIYEKIDNDFFIPIFRNFVNTENKVELSFKARQLPIVPDNFSVPATVNAYMNFEVLGANQVKISLDIDNLDMNVFPSIGWDITRDPLNATSSEFIETTTDHSIILDINEKTDVSATVLFFDPNDITNISTVLLGSFIEFDQDGELNFTTVDYDYTVEEIPNGARMALSTFDLQYVDESGKFYSSAIGEQTDDAYFEITSVESYLNNAAGQKTMKLDVETSCRLYAEDGASILLTNGVGVIGVAVPE